jgi:hypothetical protein
MLKAALAGALVLAAVGVMPASADPMENTGGLHRGGQSAGISESQIAQAKAALRLKPEQERHWPRVAAALRAVARVAARAEADESGFVQRVRGRATQAAGARRVMAAAMPLIRSLDAEQKQTAMSMVRAAGFGSLASRL